MKKDLKAFDRIEHNYLPVPPRVKAQAHLDRACFNARILQRKLDDATLIPETLNVAEIHAEGLLDAIRCAKAAMAKAQPLNWEKWKVHPDYLK